MGACLNQVESTSTAPTEVSQSVPVHRDCKSEPATVYNVSGFCTDNAITCAWLVQDQGASTTGVSSASGAHALRMQAAPASLQRICVHELESIM